MSRFVKHSSDPISSILWAFIDTISDEEFSLGYLIQELKESSFGVFLLVMALPNALLIGTLPGVSAIFGIALIFASTQMIFGRHYLWLPPFFSEKKLSREKFVKLLRVSTPTLVRLENYLRPHREIFTGNLSKRIVGLICLILSILITLPLPLGNFLPGVSLVIIALGLIERDGVFIVGGSLLGILSIFFIYYIYNTFISLANSLF